MGRRCLLILAVLAGTLVPTSVSAGAPGPGADAGIGQFAYATSIVHMDGHDYMYIAGGQRSIRANGKTRTTAYAKRARCLTMNTKRIKLIACAAFIFPRRVPERAFEFDPLLESARLRLPGKGGEGSTAMSWKGRGVPEPDAGPYADPSYGGGVYADAYRNARAGGKILGERFPARYGFALLMEGAGAGAYTGRNVSITPTESGALKVEALYRIPR